MKFLAYCLAAVLVAGCMSPASSAQDGESNLALPSAVPNLVNFSGDAIDLRGIPLSRPIGITFALYRSEKGGQPLWRETQNVTPDSLGHYTVSLGAATPAGIPLDLFTTGDAHWLGVQLEGQPEDRRILLVSVPYALKARDAETISGQPAANFVTQQQLAAHIAATAAALTSQVTPQFITPTGSGTIGSIPIWVSFSSLGDSAIFQTGTGSSVKIGISNQTPATTLDVNGITTLRNKLVFLSQTSSATSGFGSPSLVFTASAFKTGSGPVSQNYYWTASPIGTNTATPTSKLALSFGAGSAAPAATGLSIAPTGILTFAPGQTYPGSITSITAASPLTGGGTTGKVNIGLDPVALATTLNTQYPQLSTPNTFTQYQTMTQGLTVFGQASANLVESKTGYDLAENAFDTGDFSNANASLGFSFSPSNTGKDDLGVGFGALAANTGGSENTAVGANSLAVNAGGSQNTAVGSRSLNANTSGRFNTAIGYNAGQTATGAQTDGTNNTFIGYQAGPGTTSSLFEATAIGAAAIVSQNYSLILGGTAGDAVTVGIGTAAPFNDYALDVEATTLSAINSGLVVNAGGGNIYLGMTNNTHEFRVDNNGEVHAAGGFTASGADFAESMAVLGKRAAYQPGDLLVIDPSGPRRLALSTTPYSTLVAGIYSTKPGMLATPHDIDDPRPDTTEVPLAVVGIVPSKVTTQNGPIRVGDLLVTSSRPGYAMRGTDRSRMLGAVVGKALEPLAKGTGVIQVLVTLQ